MLPATIAARGRAVARGYGELLMLNAPGVSPLSAYRYSPYTVPSSAAAAVAAAAAAASSSSTAAVSTSSPTQTLSHLTLSKGQQTSLAGIVAAGQTASATVPTIQQIQHQHLVAALGNTAGPVLSLTSQAPQTQQPSAGQQPMQQPRVTMQAQPAVNQTAAAAQQQLQHLQQLQILSLDSAGRLIPTTIPNSQPVVTAQPPNLAQFASTTLTVANGGMPASAAAALAAASCKQRTATVSTPVGLTAGTQSAATSSELQSQITYSVNDLVNFQSLQPLEAAANYQVPVGL